MLDDTEDEASVSQQWVTIMDRGGLKIINNKTFNRSSLYWEIQNKESLQKSKGIRAEVGGTSKESSQ